jgi:hypothetical protein
MAQPCALARDATVQDEQLLALRLDAAREVKAMVMVPDQPRAVVILYPGDSGAMGLSGSTGMVMLNQLGMFDFSMRARNHFFKRGVAVIALDAVSGQQMTASDREQSAQVAAVMLDQVRRQTGLAPSLPVWVIGSREGSISAVALAVLQPSPVSGLVLVSAVTRPGAAQGDWAQQRTAGVASMVIGGVDKPVLVLANQDDRCPMSPVDDAKSLLAGFSSSARREAKVMTGDNPVGDACGRVSPHNFFALVAPAAEAIVQFMGL